MDQLWQRGDQFEAVRITKQQELQDGPAKTDKDGPGKPLGGSTAQARN